MSSILLTLLASEFHPPPFTNGCRPIGYLQFMNHCLRLLVDICNSKQEPKRDFSENVRALYTCANVVCIKLLLTYLLT